MVEVRLGAAVQVVRAVLVAAHVEEQQLGPLVASLAFACASALHRLQLALPSQPAEQWVPLDQHQHQLLLALVPLVQVLEEMVPVAEQSEQGLTATPGLVCGCSPRRTFRRIPACWGIPCSHSFCWMCEMKAAARIWNELCL